MQIDSERSDVTYGPRSATPPATGRHLSVVVPVYNQAAWVTRSLVRVAEEVAAAGWRDPEIVVVDDGSTDDTPAVLANLSLPVPIRIVRQENAGRFAARRTGIKTARSELVLLLDSRVLIERGALAWLLEHVSEEALVWNAHCFVETSGNVYGAFWDALPRIAWADYLDDPKTTSFGLEQFDRYPVGTGCFLAPRHLFLEAYEGFSSRYEDERNVNDDTALIRVIAKQHRIWISPHFACWYFPRGSLKSFMPHTLHRGIHLVDGHMHKGGRYAPAIVAFYPVSLAVALGTLRWRWLPLAALAGADAAGVTLAASKKLPPGHIKAIARVMPFFCVAYGLGLWKGLALSVNTQTRRRLRGWRS